MDVWRITVAALRRWYVLLPLLALSGFAAYLGGSGVQPEYDATGSAMVVPGQTAPPTIPNPYGNVEDTNTVLGIVLNSPETRSQIAAKGLSPNFEVTSLPRSTITNFSIRADSPEMAIATGDAIFEIASAELQTRQEKAGVPAGERYTLDVLQQPALSAMVTEGKIRNMAIIGVIGAALSLIVAVLFDDIIGLIRRRRKRRHSKSMEADATARQDETAEPPSDSPIEAGEDSRAKHARRVRERNVAPDADMADADGLLEDIGDRDRTMDRTVAAHDSR